jgi:hypothetical protein
MIFRRLLLVTAIAATLVPATNVAPSAAKSMQVEASLLSKGKGTQTLTGGGLVFGTLSRGGSVRVRDMAGDLSKTVTGALARNMPDGSKMYVISGRNATFKLSGTRYQVILRGNSTLNGIGVYGKASFKGNGTYQLSGGDALVWDGIVDLGKPSGRH